MVAPAVVAQRGRPLWEHSPFAGEPALQQLRYTPVHSKRAGSLARDGYEPRFTHRCRQLVGVTVPAGASDVALNRSLLAVCDNLAHVVGGDDGAEEFRSVVVAVVAEAPLSESLARFVRAIGVYDDSLARGGGGADRDSDPEAEPEREPEQPNPPNEEDPPTLHVFETAVHVREDHNFETMYPPLQLVLAVTEAQRPGELAAQRWVLQGFADVLRPDFVLMLRAGFVPRPRAFAKFLRTLGGDARAAAVTGPLEADALDVMNPFVSAHAFELAAQHALLKPAQSLTGFVHDIPLTFCALRFELAREPLARFFAAMDADGELAPGPTLAFLLASRAPTKYARNAAAGVPLAGSLMQLVALKRAAYVGGYLAQARVVRGWWAGGVRRRAALLPGALHMCGALALKSLVLALTCAVPLYAASFDDGALNEISLVWRALATVGLVFHGVFAVGNREPSARLHTFLSTINGVAWCTLLWALYVIASSRSEHLGLAFLPAALLAVVLVAGALHGQLGRLLACTAQYVWLVPTLLSATWAYALGSCSRFRLRVALVAGNLAAILAVSDAERARLVLNYLAAGTFAYALLLLVLSLLLALRARWLFVVRRLL